MSSCLEKSTMMRNRPGFLFFLLIVSFCIILSSLLIYINHETVDNTLISGDNNNNLNWLLRSSQSPGTNSNIVGRGGGDDDGGCDFYDGNWVWDERYPHYESCGMIETAFRCQDNGRPDALYTKWRWQPKHCDLPRFDAKYMLKKLKNRRVVFVGDSTGRNQWESLICLLSTVVSNKSRVYEVNGHPLSKSEGFLVVKFEGYNCTVEYFVARFLVVDWSNPPPGSPNFVSKTVKLDQILPISERWKDADILIFNSGHWWFDHVTKNKGMYYEKRNKVRINMTHENAYHEAIKTLLRWIDNEVNTTRTHVFLRTYGPSHFSGGGWNTGGGCQCDNLPNLTLPFMPNAYPYYEIVANAYLNISKRLNIGLLNITYLTAQRKDAHPSKFDHNLKPDIMSGKSLPPHQDCLHWCLPGVPDMWNELLYAEFFLRKDSNVN